MKTIFQTQPHLASVELIPNQEAVQKNWTGVQQILHKPNYVTIYTPQTVSLRNEGGIELLHLSLGFGILPDPDCQLTWLRLGVRIDTYHGTESGNGGAIACDMFPNDVVKRISYSRQIMVTSGQKYTAVVSAPDEHAAEITYLPHIISFGRTTRTPCWDIRSKSIQGDIELFLLMQRTSGVECSIQFIMAAEIKYDKFLIPLRKKSVIMEPVYRISPTVNKDETMLQSNSRGTSSTGEKKPSLVKILFLASDPLDTKRLRLGEEAREIGEKLQLAKMRERFQFYQRTAVRPADLMQALLDVQPEVVHFSGHGTENGELCLENKLGHLHPVSTDALAALFEQFRSQIKCVILNACYSEVQAKAIVKHIPYVIGMRTEIGDKAAIAFSVGFYQGLGANRSIEDSYRLGCVQIRLEGIPEHLTPILISSYEDLL